MQGDINNLVNKLEGISKAILKSNLHLHLKSKNKNINFSKRKSNRNNLTKDMILSLNIVFHLELSLKQREYSHKF